MLTNTTGEPVINSILSTSDVYDTAYILTRGEPFIEAKFDENKKLVEFRFRSNRSLRDFQIELLNGQEVPARIFIENLKFAQHAIKTARREVERRNGGGVR